MANKILILGESGRGKSTSIESLNPATTFIINVDGSSLPFKGWKSKYKRVTDANGKFSLMQSNMYIGDDPVNIYKLISAIADLRKEVTTIIIDTFSSLLVADFMAKSKVKGFEKFTDMAEIAYKLVRDVDNYREDLTIIFLAHIETSDSTGRMESKLFIPGGKLLKEKARLEPLFDVVLMADVEFSESGNQYFFKTQTDGTDVCKSPKGMFESYRVPNDLDFVLNKINEYSN